MRSRHRRVARWWRPRDAFFGPTESVPLAEASGRIAAEQITPYPPGVPAAVPG
jgi:lysine decarboxylase